jgi:hypothetical protein
MRGRGAMPMGDPPNAMSVASHKVRRSVFIEGIPTVVAGPVRHEEGSLRMFS